MVCYAVPPPSSVISAPDWKEQCNPRNLNRDHPSAAHPRPFNLPPHLEQMPHSARSPASELGDLRWRHEVGIGFEGRAPLKARDPSLIPAAPHGNGAAAGLDTTAD